MKNTLKKTLGFVLALALTLTAIGCGVAYADMNRSAPAKSPVVVEPSPADAPTAPAPAAPSVPASAAAESVTAEKAKSLAKEAVGVDAPHIIRAERDDGKFEVTLCDGNIEYDVDISIVRGRVLEIDRDWDGCDSCERDFDDDWDDRYDDWDDRYDD